MPDLGMPAIMKDAETEPEAAHLRNVIRQVLSIIEADSRQLTDKTLTRLHRVAREALRRERTNGTVIDALVEENGRLKEEVFDLRQRLRNYRETLVSKGQIGQ